MEKEQELALRRLRAARDEVATRRARRCRRDLVAAAAKVLPAGLAWVAVIFFEAVEATRMLAGGYRPGLMVAAAMFAGLFAALSLTGRFERRVEAAFRQSSVSCPEKRARRISDAAFVIALVVGITRGLAG